MLAVQIFNYLPQLYVHSHFKMKVTKVFLFLFFCFFFFVQGYWILVIVGIDIVSLVMGLSQESLLLCELANYFPNLFFLSNVYTLHLDIHDHNNKSLMLIGQQAKG